MKHNLGNQMWITNISIDILPGLKLFKHGNFQQILHFENVLFIPLWGPGSFRLCNFYLVNFQWNSICLCPELHKIIVFHSQVIDSGNPGLKLSMDLLYCTKSPQKTRDFICWRNQLLSNSMKYKYFVYMYKCRYG